MYCDLCNRNLYQSIRYKVWIYRKVDGVKHLVSEKDTVLCERCFRLVKKWVEKQGLFLRYRKLPILGVPRDVVWDTTFYEMMKKAYEETMHYSGGKNNGSQREVTHPS